MSYRPWGRKTLQKLGWKWQKIFCAVLPSRREREREKFEKGFQKVFESVKALFLKNLKHDVRLIEKQVLSIEPGRGSLNFLNKISSDLYTYPLLSIFLLHNHSVGQPFRIEYFFNSPSLLKFHHIVFDSIRMILRWAPRWLLPWGDRWVDVQMMVDEARIHPRSFVSIPREHINVLLEKLCQLLLLLRR